MGSLLDLDLWYTDLPDPLEPGFDIHVWNQAGLHTDERYPWWAGTHLHRVASDHEKGRRPTSRSDHAHPRIASCLLVHQAAEHDESRTRPAIVDSVDELGVHSESAQGWMVSPPPRGHPHRARRTSRAQSTQVDVSRPRGLQWVCRRDAKHQ